MEVYGWFAPIRFKSNTERGGVHLGDGKVPGQTGWKWDIQSFHPFPSRVSVRWEKEENPTEPQKNIKTLQRHVCVCVREKESASLSVNSDVSLVCVWDTKCLGTLWRSPLCHQPPRHNYPLMSNWHLRLTRLIERGRIAMKWRASVRQAVTWLVSRFVTLLSAYIICPCKFTLPN